jgi:hypothetical protein
VEQIEAVRSVDLVSDPATSRGLFEHRERWEADHTRGGSPPTKGDEMDPKQQPEYTLSGIIEWAKGRGPETTALTEHFAGPLLKKAGEDLGAATASIAALTTERDAAKTALTEAKTKLDGFEAAAAIADKGKRLQEALNASDLVKRFSKIEQAVTAEFRAALMESKEDAWPTLIADRVKVFDAVSRSVGAGGGGNGRPRSETKQESQGNGAPAGDAYDRVLQAFA